MTPRRLTAAVAALLLAVLPLAACGPGDADGTSGGGDAGGTGAAGQEVRDGAQDVPDTEDPAPDTASEGEDPALPTTTLRVGGHEIRVEVADDDDERRRGLMHRESLPADHGMLFVYPEERTLSFWMRNTSIPLDIAYLDRRGTIVDIQSMDPRTDRLYESRQPAMYALETNRGWFEAHGVEVGDRVEF